MNTTSHPAVGRIGLYRAIHLSKILDPASEKRQCVLRRHEAPVLGVTDYHSDSVFVENSMHGSFVRTTGIARAKAKIGIMNLTYNICRCVQLKIEVSMG